MEKANIFDIKHYAVHDGPGIRTTFFLMGCPLHCLWCQNPESQKDAPVITFTKAKCIGCGKCAEVCGKLDQFLQLSRNKCRLCGACVHSCPTGAKQFGSKSYTPVDILETVLPEKIFFDESGGGVTFSGGECLAHSAFLKQCCRLLKEHGIHTVIDTCGAVPWSAFEQVLPYVDMFLYDLKKMDPALHKVYTGMDNMQILENLRSLAEANARIIIRVPLIPGYTDSEEDLQKIGAFLRDTIQNRIERCELLPYNKLAESKYGNKTVWSDVTLGEYQLKGLEAQSNEQLTALKDILLSFGVPAYTESL